MKIIDRFLPEDYFKSIVDGVVWNPGFTWNLQNIVATDGENPSDWYATHNIYRDNTPQSEYWEGIDRKVSGN